MAEAQGLTFRRITEAEALAALGDFRHMDPAGIAKSTREIIKGAQCFHIGGACDAVYVLRVIDDAVCVEAAKGSGSVDVTAVMDEAMTRQAAGFRRLVMQTKRPGLVRKLQKRGWSVKGWIMEKGL